MGDIGKEHQLVFRELLLYFYLIAQVIHVTDDAIDGIKYKNQQQEIKQVGPDGTPERRRNDNPECRILFAPLPGGVACFYMKVVSTRFQILIGGKSQSGRNAPFLVIPFQFIAELRRNRSRVIQRGEINSE